MKETTNVKETTTMKRKLGALLAATATVATMAMTTAGPASADDLDADELFLFGHYSVVDDVDYENVRERNDRDDECRVDDVDLDDVVPEYELVCYY